MAAEHGVAFQRLALGEADVFHLLRHRLELPRQGAHPLARPHQLGQHLQGGDQAVAGGGVVGQDDVAGGFAAQVEPALAHALP